MSATDLVAEVYRPASGWKARAHCGPETHHLFFPSTGRSDTANQAREICAGCPVRVECLDFALENHEGHYDYGIWGGLTHRERQRLRRKLARSA